MTIELENFSTGDTTYINKLNSNNSKMQSLANLLEEDVEALKQTSFFSAALDYRLLAQNLLVNGSFDYWQRGENLRPDVWKLNNISGFAVEQDTGNLKANLYSVKSTGEGQLKQKLTDEIRKSIITTTTITFGCWIKTATEDIGRIGISDGVTTKYSTFHTGNDEFQFLSVNYTSGSDTAPSELEFILDNAGGTVYFNSAVVIRGNPTSGPIFIANDPIVEKLRVLSLYEICRVVVSGVGFKVLDDRQLTTRVRFCAPKLKVPTVTLLDDLDTGYDYEIFDITKCGFSVTITDIDDANGLDGFEFSDLDFLAEVESF